MSGGTATFDDLVTAATVGVDRKPLPIAAGSSAGEGDQAAALLDAAALQTVARRAGYRPPHGVTVPEAPGETAQVFSIRAARALREACDWKPGRGPDLDNTPQAGLLTDLLDAAARAGYAASPLLLPGLLDAAARRTTLRPAVAAVLGPHGRWLGAQRPDWRPVAELAELTTRADTATGRPDHSPAAVWRTGMSAPRRAYLARLRETDPDAARELLADGWAKETGADRGEFIAVLDHGLSMADEVFLEAALDDRASAVRAAARRMLTRLPGSAFGQRASERAGTVLRAERGGRAIRLVAALPGAPDAGALRDGVTVSPPSPSIGAGAWLLTQVIARAPLDDWTARFGLSPADIASLPVADDLRADVHAGWRIAAVRQRNAEWARALLQADTPDAGGNRPPAAWPPDRELAALLPAEQRAARAAALLASAPLSAVHPPGWVSEAMPLVAEISDWPTPWPRALSDAVLAAVARAAMAGRLRGVAGMLLAAAGRGLPATGPVDYAAALTRLADQYSHSAPPLRAAAATITARRVFLTEIGTGRDAATGVAEEDQGRPD
ncbi:MAG TPA: DUF5691 domain-containing protein [Trebonia sp.]